MQAFERFATMQSAVVDSQVAAFKKSDAHGNKILAALPDADMARLIPHLEEISLPLGMRLRRSGEDAANVYFLGSGVASFLQIAIGGEMTELALTGPEGMVGVESFLGGNSMPMDTVMLCAGQAYRINASRLIEAFYLSVSLRQVLLRYAQSFLTQIEQTAICNRHHPIERRLCRFLLLCLDCQSSNEIVLTQDSISNMLGVRREGVTEAARKLRDAGLITCRRGHITVVDRIGLELHTCECYAVVKKEYARLAYDSNDRQSTKINLKTSVPVNMSKNGYLYRLCATRDAYQRYHVLGASDV